jgi:hypothetical protein
MFSGMKRCAILFLATALAAGAAESPVKISVLDNAVLCVRATRVPENVTEQIRAAAPTNRLFGTVLDLRFADGAATNAASYFAHRKLPLVILVNSRTRGAAAALATRLRAEDAAILIGSTNPPGAITPDIAVGTSLEDERKFQENPFYEPAANPADTLSATNNLLAFVDHTSEADLVRKHIKDGDDDGDIEMPRVEPLPPVIHDPALARAVDLLKALADLHKWRG